MPSESTKSRAQTVIKWFSLSVSGFAFVVALGAALLHWYSPVNRAWVIKALEKRYDANVELREFNASLYPTVSIIGAGLVLRRKDQPNLPPLASISRFSISADWAGLLLHTRRFR